MLLIPTSFLFKRYMKEGGGGYQQAAFVSTEEDSFLEWLWENGAPENFLLEIKEISSSKIVDYAMGVELYKQVQLNDFQERGIVLDKTDKLRTVCITVMCSETGCWYGRIVWIPEPSYTGS